MIQGRLAAARVHLKTFTDGLLIQSLGSQLMMMTLWLGSDKHNVAAQYLVLSVTGPGSLFACIEVFFEIFYRAIFKYLTQKVINKNKQKHINVTSHVRDVGYTFLD